MRGLLHREEHETLGGEGVQMARTCGDPCRRSSVLRASALGAFTSFFLFFARSRVAPCVGYLVVGGYVIVGFIAVIIRLCLFHPIYKTHLQHATPALCVQMRTIVDSTSKSQDSVAKAGKVRKSRAEFCSAVVSA